MRQLNAEGVRARGRGAAGAETSAEGGRVEAPRGVVYGEGVCPSLSD